MPFIGITTSETIIASPNSCLRPVTTVNQAYVELASSFNAVPLLLSCRTPILQVEPLTSMLDGLILIGGQDIDPQMWAATNQVQYQSNLQGMGKPFLRPIDYQPSIVRDRFEVALYHSAKRRRIPILGICRGLQLINVAEGGTLHQELPEPMTVQHGKGDDGFIHHHLITIDKKSKVFALMQTEQYVMSSLHHQGIDRLGQNLKKAAWADDGLIEIIEGVDNDNFVVGVHGHIEQTRQNLRLYDTILQAFYERAGASYELRNQQHRQTNTALP